MNTTDNDKLIADFMDLEFVLSPEFGRDGKWRLTNSPYSKIFTQSHCVYLDFDKSWSWLMPVVEKIESLGFGVSVGSQSNPNHCYIMIEEGRHDNAICVYEADSKLKAVYDACVKFIQWYNEKNAKQ